MAFAFAGCTCAGPGSGPPPTATAKPSTPTVPIPATSTAAPAPTAVPVEPTAAPAAAPTEDPAAAAARSEKMTKCESYVAVLAGKSKDAALMSNAEVKALALLNPELVMCGAVATDSSDLCKNFLPVEQGPTQTCVRTQAIFHELKTYPGKNTFMFSDIDWQECRGIKALEGFCDGLRAALRSGKPEDCAKVAGGDGDSFCRAYMTLDKSLCAVSGKLAQVEFSLPDQKEGEPKSYKVSDIAAADCREKIESRAFLGKGLEAIAASGPERERALAKAALGQADACATVAAPTLSACSAGAPVPQGAAPQGGAPAAPAGGGSDAPKPG